MPKTNPQSLAGLTVEEQEIYQAHLDYFSDLDEHPERPQAFTDAIAVSQKFLKSLSACRVLLEKYPPAEINEPDYKEWKRQLEGLPRKDK